MALAVRPVLVGFCLSCEAVYDPYPGPGVACDGDDVEKDTPYYHHRLYKRLMWKCSHEECEEEYWMTKKLLERHLQDHRVGV